MTQNIWLTTITVFIIILYLKWILIAFAYPCQVLYVIGLKKQNNFRRFLIFPNSVVERVFRGGVLRYTLYWIGFIPIHKLRKILYKGLGADLAKGVVIHFRTEMRAPWNLKIGERSIIGDNAILDARNSLTIGSDVNLSSNVSIYTMQHNHRDPNFGVEFNRPMEVKIGNRAWIGSNVTVLPGVTIGEGAVCCAGCIVTKDVPPFSIVAGVPAAKVGERTRDLCYKFNGRAGSIY